VTDRFSNRLGTLHGGATATLFDICTTTALVPVARVGFWQYAGVTRSLNVSYMRPVPIGSTVRVVSTVTHAGKRLASIRGELRDMQGKLLAFCEHLKATNDPPAEKL
jgi:acyl-coenzyme A thioesterase 13